MRTHSNDSNGGKKYSQASDNTTARPSTKFDLNELKKNNFYEINSAAKKYFYLSPGQKDLIRHQAPDAYAAIVKIAEEAKASQETAFKAQAHTSNNAYSAMFEQMRNRESSRDEKNDGYSASDRLHERTTASIERQNSDNNTTYVQLAVTAGIVLVGTTVALVFGGSKK